MLLLCCSSNCVVVLWGYKIIVLKVSIDLGPVSRNILALWPVSRNILSLETDISSLITLATFVFSMLKITSAFKIFFRNQPLKLNLSMEKTMDIKIIGGLKPVSGSFFSGKLSVVLRALNRLCATFITPFEVTNNDYNIN